MRNLSFGSLSSAPPVTPFAPCAPFTGFAREPRG